VSQLVPCTAIIMRHLAPAVSIIAGGVLPRCATIVQGSRSSLATARKARLIANLRRCVPLVSLPQALSQQIAPCDLEQSP
jgi:hypothetical protein